MGSRKRCKRGKSCGASCINKNKTCRVDLQQRLSDDSAKVANKVKTISLSKPGISLNKSSSPASAAPSTVTPAVTPAVTTAPSLPTNRTVEARKIADEVDDTLKKEGLSSQKGDKNYDWEASKGSGSKFLGEGAYGTVTMERGSGNVVKRGDIGSGEAGALEKIGKLDLGPRLLAAEIDGLGGNGFNPDIRIGRVAMTLVPGETIGRTREPDDKIGGQRVADAYWRARSQLHRAGVAHNDMHIENVMVDSRGKGRFVDFGMSQDNVKAALAEALGAFSYKDGDGQAKRFKGNGGEILMKALSNPNSKDPNLFNRAPVLGKIWENRKRVMEEMEKDGISAFNMDLLFKHGTGKPLKSFEQGVWSEVSDAQARKYIDMLYDGV